MMAKNLAFLLLLALVSQPNIADAQNETGAEDAESKSQVRNPDVEAFREIVCDFAANFRGENALKAVALVEKHQFVDERFNASIYLVVRDLMKSDSWDQSAADYMLKLMPFCTLEQNVRVKLTVESYVKCAEHIRMEMKGKRLFSTNMQNRILNRLQQDPIALGEILLEQMEHDDYPTDLIVLAKYCGGAREKLLPKLLEATGSQDAERSALALSVASELVAQINKFAGRSANIKPDLDVTTVIEEKFRSYAKRLVTRYDMDEDGVLDQEECRKMLVNPIGADTNGDGFVSIRELALSFAEKDARNEPIPLQ